jgi:hypothetical protein
MKKILILGVVALMLTFGMVQAGCNLFGCPDVKDCYAKSGTFWAGYTGDVDQCSENCITDQAEYNLGGDMYYFSEDKSCNCK